ncbi:hypothetical protein QVD17_02545 [Tagetes erecta]|uniref:Uncharacterized protein n=1 Tax=Tagetes erecta TaxID=13708 RepID=A0AAD8LBV7_TARER|nr:hypothetical protein QVD17_02545 [Tagetes erecta]
MGLKDGKNGLPENGLATKRGGWKSVKLNTLDRAPGSTDHVDDSVGIHKIQHVSKTLKYLSVFSKRQSTAEALNGLKFIGKNDEITKKNLDKQFGELTKETNGLLLRKHFGQCIGMNKDSNDFAEDLFDSLCRRRNITGDLINKTQFNDFWEEIADPSFDSRLRIFLNMVDKDKDGKITETEVREIIMVSASANKLSTIKNHAGKYASLIMAELDQDKHGYIMIEKLEKLLKDAATQNKRQNLSEPKHSNSLERGWYEDLKYFLHDNWKRCVMVRPRYITRCWVIILWIGIMVGLFTWKYIQYKHRAVYDVLGPCVCIAKGAAETLKLNMAIMLLPVCRNTITWLRNKTKLGGVVPFDDNINFHQVIAVAIAIGVGLHALSHLTCDFPRLIHATEEEYRPMQQFFGDQAKNYWHFVKEVEGYTGIIMVVLMTIAFTLAWLRQGNKFKPPLVLKKLMRFKAIKNSKIYNGFVSNLTAFISKLNNLTGFNAFWYSHHLFVIVYALLIVHGIKLYLTKKWYKKTTWMYLAVPILLYACERLIRTFRSRIDPAKVLRATAYPGGVLALRMTKPTNFKYKSGEYMFVKCVDVSPFEWHPFSITSAPGDDYLSVHIRALGDWTKKINTVFSEVCTLDDKSGIRSVDFTEENLNIPKVIVDGPYGAPAQDYKSYDVVLLVGLGIGATPMISIVKDIVNSMKAKEDEENALENGAKLRKNKISPIKANEFKTKRAYFYWVTKEQDSFEWFEDVMNEIAEIDKNGVIEVHNYCTSVYEEGDARSTLIAILQSLNHAKNGVDVVSGTRVKTHFAKPNWEDVYTQIAANHMGSETGVFYCGPPVVAKQLKKLALDFSDSSTSTTFVFHKENF